MRVVAGNLNQMVSKVVGGNPQQQGTLENSSASDCVESRMAESKLTHGIPEEDRDTSSFEET